MKVQSDYIKIYDFDIRYPRYPHISPFPLVRNFGYIGKSDRTEVRGACTFDCFKIGIL